jgi:hypothetical protein
MICVSKSRKTCSSKMQKDITNDAVRTRADNVQESFNADESSLNLPP